ncbi:DNA polymerase III subunit gamma/tau [Rickettsiales endosymbiont of Trichoplax sp. H2]|uniref:DNA polymerase III subunit gamma/tau n=1 Tax=Rickettsiales endosymbiont of Trichoplax sp. H2 TaxID=2021221 RepID=UPI0012B3F46F|nr:DNA polymerase III subunit gamma/tau [Rickettsiales endosymbiont of Trichoplax sp. H2]MSO14350.1 DNA polymerase III subunit tau/gamma [Rickettsiales endosymbiont of Trichoplax sp. H2]
MVNQGDIFADDSNKKEKYKVLARKYRPRLFNDIISQSHIITVIKNSIESNKIHHAYMLTGIRGVGKTTFARIVAKALNCINSKDNLPIFTPCLTCSNCVSIEEGRHQDILEIDAASNTGVADIREIIENSKYKPIASRYKVYIIDEVHMLSNSAFNALLKTLEEPPEHVKFILATTEIRKIPLTVLSRCQRFDLHRLDLNQLAKYLQEIANKEGFEIDEKNASLISKAAQGSVRDGLSLLDQAILTCKNTNVIGSDLLEKMLGIVNLEYIYQLFDYILKGSTQDTLKCLRDLYIKGAEPYIMLQELMEISYKISLCKIGNAKNLILSDYELDKCNKIAEKISVITITRFWQMFNKALVDVKNSYDPMLTLEMNIIKICYANFTITPEEILKSFNNEDNKGKISFNTSEQNVKKNPLI